MNKWKQGIVGLVALAFFTPLLCGAPTSADLVFVVDESGSMSGEHAWLSGMVAALDAELLAAGVTGRYGLVGFGSSTVAPRMINVGGGQFGTATEFGTATGSLLINGATEDGYAGLDFAFNNYTFNPSAAINYILVTDEERDNTNATLNFANIQTALENQNALLNVVVNNPFTCDAGAALGVDADLNGYRADGVGGYTTCANGVVGDGYSTTETDYVQLALNVKGAGWDLNQLRVGGDTAVSFTDAFVDIKVQEIITSVPEPTSYLLGGNMLFLLWYMRRRRQQQ